MSVSYNFTFSYDGASHTGSLSITANGVDYNVDGTFNLENGYTLIPSTGDNANNVEIFSKLENNEFSLAIGTNKTAIYNADVTSMVNGDIAYESVVMDSIASAISGSGTPTTSGSGTPTTSGSGTPTTSGSGTPTTSGSGDINVFEYPEVITQSVIESPDIFDWQGNVESWANPESSLDTQSSGNATIRLDTHNFNGHSQLVDFGVIHPVDVNPNMNIDYFVYTQPTYNEYTAIPKQMILVMVAGKLNDYLEYYDFSTINFTLTGGAYTVGDTHIILPNTEGAEIRLNAVNNFFKDPQLEDVVFGYYFTVQEWYPHPSYVNGDPIYGKFGKIGAYSIT